MATKKLQDYEAKRHFDKTPEPPPRVPRTSQSRFCIQRHNARRLHYDFRLEHDGVLVSWAVPRGPSRTPADKRMAVAVEDHPVDYLEFEGVIPADNYGAGSVMLWDLGTYELLGDLSFEEQYRKGDVKFFLHGQKLQGAWVLVRTNKPGGKDWLLIKKKDEYVSTAWDIDEYSYSVASGLSQQEIAAGLTGKEWTRAGLSEKEAPPAPSSSARHSRLRLPAAAPKTIFPASVSVMRPTATAPFSADDWVFELSWPGRRALLCKEGERFRVLGDDGAALSTQFPELERARNAIGADSFIIDGDIVSLTNEGLADEAALARRLEARSEMTSTRLARSSPVVYYATDLLYANGRDLRELSWHERRKLLEKVLAPDDVLRLSDYVQREGEALYALATQRGAPGVVGKQRDSHYEGGRSRQWVLFGHHAEVELDDGTAEVVEAEAGHAPRVLPPLLSGKQTSQKVTLEGHEVTLNNLNKPWFPEAGFVKRDVLNFYARIAEFLLPYLKDRPLSLKRYPDGIHGQFFFQKRPTTNYPAWLPVVTVKDTEGEDLDVYVCNDRDQLVYYANLACIDQNPWMSRVDSLDEPDFMLLDLDPQDCSYDMVVEAAHVLKRYLDKLGLQGCPKTSGASGLHIYVPLGPGHSYEQTRTMAQILARLAASERPDLFTLPRAVEKRETGKVYMDHPQNRRGSTIAAPYVLRPEPEASVATPLEWSEVKRGLRPSQFTLSNIFKRLEKKGDIFAPVLHLKQSLQASMPLLEDLMRA
jgi:bifunctional non-homologous end joining protein LigD